MNRLFPSSGPTLWHWLLGVPAGYGLGLLVKLAWPHVSAMAWPDLVNAFFEVAGGVMVWTNVLAIRRDKQVKGWNVWATVVFNAWGIWNLYYYPSLGQWASFAGGLVIVTANTAWLWLAYKYRPRPLVFGPGSKRPIPQPMPEYKPLIVRLFCDTCGREKPVPANLRWREGSRSVWCPDCRQGDWSNHHHQRHPGFKHWVLALLGKERP